MAAADSRAGWKRNANRCFIHENVSKAPNSSSFPSSSSSSSNQPPDLKWWFYSKPNVGHQKGFENEQLNSSETELDILSYEFINRAALEGLGTQVDTKKNDDSFLDPSRKVSAASMKEDRFVRMSKPDTGLDGNSQNIGKDKDIEESWCMDEDLDTVNSLFSEQSKKISSDLESNWMKAEKTEPWWRKADKDTLASMVAQSSVKHIENCDLPQPQTLHFRKGLSASLERSDQDDEVAPSLDQIAEPGFSNVADCTAKSHTSVSMDEKQSSLGAMGSSPNHSNASFRNNGEEETCHVPEHVSKAQLVKALCHSQTRAREAEKAARKAYEEKEHIIKLFFKQASQLFAYKQWLQLLQLENIPLEPKDRDRSIFNRVPTVSPWIPYEAQKHGNCQYQGPKKKKKKKGSTTNGNRVNRYAVAFALGLGLTGAGLLLGWTLGWLFPRLQTGSGSRPASPSSSSSSSSSSSVQNSDSG